MAEIICSQTSFSSQLHQPLHTSRGDISRSASTEFSHPRCLLVRSSRRLCFSRVLHPLSEQFKSEPSALTKRISEEIRSLHCRSQQKDILICTHRTCRKDGALETLDLFRGLAPPDVTVDTCGCLGRCGSGPNAVILPGELLVSHCNTPTHVARLLAIQCGAEQPETNLRCLELKNRANEAFARGDLDTAEALFSEAIDLKPSGGLHNLYANRSATRLAKNNATGALDDAREAGRVRPNWSQARVREGDAHASLGSCTEALGAYNRAAEIDGELRRSKQFQRKIREIQTKCSALSA
eukprot:TRINITY_DN10500_c0_g1_i1.p1 TRINITY_DN10500_c0_g1~~TRINITY_DN10500_c0_g1_i1.p1  ORF type:complete len:296 (+),score=-4.81 TRINITY_DN10500_c0_g1_i1:174-1061(+)